MVMQGEGPVLFFNKQNSRLDIQEHYSQQLRMLNDMVEYGAFLMKRCFESSGKKLQDIVVIYILVKSIMQQADAIIILLEEGACYAAKVNLRVLTEAYFQLLYMIKDGIEEKSTAFYVKCKMTDVMWLKRGIEGTKEYEYFKGARADLNLAFDQEELRGQVEKIEKELKEERFYKYYKIFEKNKFKDWYFAFGKKNIREVANAVDLLSLYEVIYRSYSASVHSSKYKDHVRFIKGGVLVAYLRSVVDVNEVITFLYTAMVNTYRSVLSRYREEEVSSFMKKCREEWHPLFKAMKKVRVVDERLHQ